MSGIVALIIAHNENPSQFELLSLKRAGEVLSKYPIRLVFPKGKSYSAYKSFVEEYKIVVDEIDQKWQSNYFNFNRLKIERFLYERYKDYDHILFYEPDAFVFRDDLSSWITKGYDNVGAPWFSLKSGNLMKNSGNGGFCLRNVHSVLRTHELNRVLFLPYLVWLMIKDLPMKYIWKYKFILLRLSYPLFQRSGKFIERYPFYEDRFWAILAPAINKDFRPCPSNEALAFAFDDLPDKMYELNDRKLPMGAHGWYRKERIGFWNKHIQDLIGDYKAK